MPQTGYFLARELNHVMAKLYEKKYPEYKATKHIPVNPNPADPADKTFSVPFYDAVGTAQLGLGFPRVDVNVSETTYYIESITDSYGYTFQELREARKTGRRLSEMKALTARRAIAEREDYLAYMGDPEAGLIGLFTNPNVPTVIMPYAIYGNSNPDQIIETVNTVVNTPFNRSEREANQVLFTKRDFTWLQTQRLTSREISILEYLKKTYPGVNFDWCSRCEGAGYAGADIVFAYIKDPEYLFMEIPQPFEQLPPDVRSTETTVNCHERFGGVAVQYPFTMALGELPG